MRRISTGSGHGKGNVTRSDRFPDCSIIPGNPSTEQTGQFSWGSHGRIQETTLGASNYTYAEATWTQTLPDWIASHVRVFEFCGGCSEILVPSPCCR